MSVASPCPLRRPSSRTGSLGRAVGLVAVVMLIAAACAGGSANDRASKDRASNDRATNDKASAAVGYTYQNLDGSRENFADHLGKPLVVNFFASWCAPCVREMPDIEAVHQRYGEKVGFLGLSVRDTVEQTRDLVAQTGVTYPTGRDPAGDLLAEIGGKAMPTTAFIDATGRLRLVQSRTFSAKDLEAKIEELFKP